MKVKVFNYHCSSCGAVQIYSSKDDMLVCEFCKTSTPIITHDSIDSHVVKPSILHKFESKDITCEKCGALFQKPYYNISTKCPYCKTPILTHTLQKLVIDAILPFKISHKEAQKAFKKWVGSLWFAPTAFTKYLNGDNKLTGFYIPHFVYDTNTITYYSGARGDAYYITVNRVVRDAQGNQREIQVQERHVRWTPVSGMVKVNFKDISIPASKEIDYKIIDALSSWDMSTLKPKDFRYLSGFEATEHTISVQNSFDKAKNKMSPTIHTHIISDIGGDEQQINTISTKYISPNYKNVLLPVWIASFEWKGKHYNYAVNGYNAKVSGERPYSIIKIVFAILGIVGFIALLYVLSQNPTVQEFLSQFQDSDISQIYNYQ